MYITHRTQSVWAEAYLHTKWHLSPCSGLASIDVGQQGSVLATFLELDLLLNLFTAIDGLLM